MYVTCRSAATHTAGRKGMTSSGTVAKLFRGQFYNSMISRYINETGFGRTIQYCQLPPLRPPLFLRRCFRQPPRCGTKYHENYHSVAVPGGSLIRHALRGHQSPYTLTVYQMHLKQYSIPCRSRTIRGVYCLRLAVRRKPYTSLDTLWTGVQGAFRQKHED